MHLTLHPLDVSMVLSAGWGERHPLAGKYVHGKELVPSGFVMVYAPQQESQIETLMDIVKAGAWWVGGVDFTQANSSGREKSSVQSVTGEKLESGREAKGAWL